jgi:hypothetical protein
MPVTITNRSNQLLILPLNDGHAVYLAPGETSRPVHEMQVNGNEKLAKVARDHLVSIDARKTGSTKQAAKTRPRSKRRRAASRPAVRASRAGASRKK